MPRGTTDRPPRSNACCRSAVPTEPAAARSTSLSYPRGTTEVVEATNAVTPLDVTTLVIATIGALTGVASLVWAVTSHLLSGARVKVELLVGWAGNAGVVTIPWSSFNPSAPPPFHGIPVDFPVVGVQVRNAGRLPCSVHGWSIALDNGVALSHVPMPMNPPLPHRLDLGEEQTWFAELHTVLSMIEVSIQSNMPPKVIFGATRLGDGRSISSARHPLTR